MKYLKTYEQNILEPIIGDYVVCLEDDKSSENPKVTEFILNNIGQYIKKRNDSRFTNYPYLIKYENVPDDIIFYFDHDNKTGCRSMSPEEIIYRSINKTDCETFLASKKYNL